MRRKGSKRSVQEERYRDLSDTESDDIHINKSQKQVNENGVCDAPKIIEPGFMESFKDYRTFYLWIMIILTSSYPFYIASNFKSYEQQDLNDDSFITLVGSLGAVMNGLSRGFWATLQDFFGFKKVYLSLLVLEIVIAFTFVAVHKNKALYLIWTLISFSTLGGHFSIFAPLCAKIYGPTTGGKIFTFIFTGFATATLVNWVLTKQTSSKAIAYETLFYILASMAVVGMVLVIFLNTKTKVKKLDADVESKLPTPTEKAKLLDDSSY